jgi:hypothetical protein
MLSIGASLARAENLLSAVAFGVMIDVRDPSERLLLAGTGEGSYKP